MSFYYFGNIPASVPAVFDTTPCMNQMLNYEDCVTEYLLFYNNIKCESTSIGSDPSELAFDLA